MYAQQHAWNNMLLIAHETANAKLETEIAAKYLVTSESWVAPDTVDFEDLLDDPYPMVIEALYRNGKLTRDQFTEQRRSWVDRWTKSMAPTKFIQANLWRSAYARTVRTAEDATEALEKHKPIGWLFRASTGKAAGAIEGETFLRAGRASEAVPWLTNATSSCMQHYDPYEHTHAFYSLGEALEATGDAQGACRSYGKLLERWGKAKPRSVTADRARERVRVLSCPKG